jgi:hypothetical protein
MNPNKSTQATNSRLKVGAALLTAAQVVDTKSVTARLKAFSEAHRNYGEAQRKVDEAEARLDVEKGKLMHLDADHDEAVEALACRLVSEGEPRINPFGSFNAPAPGKIKTMEPGEAAGAVHALVTMIERNKSLSQATLDAARQAEEAAQKIDAFLPPFAVLSDEVRAARHSRDVIALSWDRKLAALRREARAVGDEGGPGLYDALFGSLRRTPKKPKTTAPPQSAAATSPPPPTPVTETPTAGTTPAAA